MQQRRFGTTDMTVSEVGFGCARLGGVFAGSSKADILYTLRQAFDRGITFYDTSDMYTQGESERILGQAFSRDRTRVVITTKVGYCVPAQANMVSRIKPLLRPVLRRLRIKRQHVPSAIRGTLRQDFSATYIVSAVERSLLRLQTDYLDLYQLHSPPPSVLASGDFVSVMEELKRQGKIRYYGVSCETEGDALVCLRYPGISSIQVALSVLDQGVVDQVLPRAADLGVGVIARQCFAGGLLARSPDVATAGDSQTEQSERQAILNYHRIAARWGRSLTEMALQFVLSTGGVSVVLLGMRTAEHVAANLRCATAPPLSNDELGTLRARPVAPSNRL